MKRSISLACAAVLAVEVFAIGSAPAIAAPMRAAPSVSIDQGSLVTEVQVRRRVRRDNTGALLGGLAAGAIIGGIIASQPRYVEPAPRYYRSRSSAHVQWCLDRYRSYDPYSDTYQPFNGPRRYCVSPYS